MESMPVFERCWESATPPRGSHYSHRYDHTFLNNNIYFCNEATNEKRAHKKDCRLIDTQIDQCLKLSVRIHVQCMCSRYLISCTGCSFSLLAWPPLAEVVPFQNCQEASANTNGNQNIWTRVDDILSQHHDSTQIHSAKHICISLTCVRPLDHSSNHPTISALMSHGRCKTRGTWVCHHHARSLCRDNTPNLHLMQISHASAAQQRMTVWIFS